MKRITLRLLSFLAVALIGYLGSGTEWNTVPAQEANPPASQPADSEVAPPTDPINENEGAFKSTVGFPQLIYQHVIPGPKVVAKPIADRRQAIVIRIVDTYAHGSDFRYDIEYRGLEPGKYNLADYLEREDKSGQPIPTIDVEVATLLGPGQVEPYMLPPVKSRFASFYLPALIVGSTVWLIGLLLILFYGRGKTKSATIQQKQLTVADRIRPLIDAAIAGELETQQKAELERVLSAFWSKKLRLGHLDADDLREQLRGHPEASVMLNQIDLWLHRPESDAETPVDVNAILKPYQSMNYEEV